MALTATWADIVTGLGINGFSGGNRARAAEMNSYVLQNIMWLNANALRYLGGAVDYDGTVLTTSSTSFVAVTGITTGTVTTRGGTVLVLAMMTTAGAGTGGNYHAATIYQDGAAVAGSDVNLGLTNYQASTKSNLVIAYVTPTAPSAAGHTFAAYVRTSNGAESVIVSQAGIYAFEIGGV
jgi:hypothetical protein